jgi:hypothetical protein
MKYPDHLKRAIYPEGKATDTSTIARSKEKKMLYRMDISPVSVVHSVRSKIHVKHLERNIT